MLTTKSWLIILGVMILLICILAAIGGITQKRAVALGVTPSVSVMRFVRTAALILFAGCAACAVPLGLRLFLAGQAQAGNSESGSVVFLREHESAVIIGVWLIWGLGFIIALPVMFRDFKADAQAASDRPPSAPNPYILREERPSGGK